MVFKLERERPPYVASEVAIGAVYQRSSDLQEHRELFSTSRRDS